MKKSIILSLVFMLIACFSSLAAIKVNGIVVDSLSLEPEPMVTIRIMQQGNDTPVALGRLHLRQGAFKAEGQRPIHIDDNSHRTQPSHP